MGRREERIPVSEGLGELGRDVDLRDRVLARESGDTPEQGAADVLVRGAGAVPGPREDVDRSVRRGGSSEWSGIRRVAVDQAVGGFRQSKWSSVATFGGVVALIWLSRSPVPPPHPQSTPAMSFK